MDVVNQSNKDNLRLPFIVRLGGLPAIPDDIFRSRCLSEALRALMSIEDDAGRLIERATDSLYALIPSASSAKTRGALLRVRRSVFNFRSPSHADVASSLAALGEPAASELEAAVRAIAEIDPDGPALRVGWRHIRGLGEKTLDALRLARGGAAAIGVGQSIGKSRGGRARAAIALEDMPTVLPPETPFTSIEDCVLRSRLRRADALQLARAGAFAAWEPDRRRAAWEALRACGDSLPLAPATRDPHSPRALSATELIYLDYFATGVSINGHPMQHMRARLQRAGVVDSQGLRSLSGGEPIIVAGLVTIRQRPASANGTIFLLLEDEWGFINVVVPSFLVDEFSEVVKFATFVLVQGRFEKDGNVLNVVGKRFKELNVKRLEHKARSFR